MALATADDLFNALLSAQRVRMAKDNLTTVAGQVYSDWLNAGQPGAATAPSTVNGSIPTQATAGAYPITAPASGKTLYLARGSGSSTGQLGIIYIYDRLWENAMDVSTASYNPSPPALTRYTSGLGVELWLHNYTAMTGAGTVTVGYTNSAGVAGRTGTAVNYGADQHRLTPVQLAAGDSGVQSVQSFTLSVAGTGTIGLTLMRRIACFGIAVVPGVQAFGPTTLLQSIDANACLTMAFLANTTSTSVRYVDLDLAAA